MKVPSYSDQLSEIRVMKDENGGSFASWRKGYVEAKITERRRKKLNEDVSAVLAQIGSYEERFVSNMC